MAVRITVVGSLNTDLVVRAPRMPAAGETILGREFHTVPGGKGANQAVAVARLGGRAMMVGRVGGDGHGDLLLESLESNGVDTALSRATRRRQPEWPSSSSIAMDRTVSWWSRGPTNSCGPPTW